MSNVPRMFTIEENKYRPYSTFEVSTKDDIYSKMSRYGCFTMGGSKNTSYTGWVSDDNKTIFVFTTEKFRAKYDHKFVDKNGNARNSKLVRNAHWKVRVYKFKLDDVKSVKQKTRTFRVVL